MQTLDHISVSFTNQLYTFQVIHVRRCNSQNIPPRKIFQCSQLTCRCTRCNAPSPPHVLKLRTCCDSRLLTDHITHEYTKKCGFLRANANSASARQESLRCLRQECSSSRHSSKVLYTSKLVIIISGKKFKVAEVPYQHCKRKPSTSAFGWCVVEAEGQYTFYTASIITLLRKLP